MRARARLSQNFLTHPRDARWIVDRSGVDAHDDVVEIGAGSGVLTTALAPRVRRLVAYEVDPRLAAALRRRFRDSPTVDCRHRDFLTTHPPRHPFAIVANIPFSRTAAIVDWCLAAPALTSATLLTQREYARKRTGDYGRWTRLTIETWPFVEWRLLGGLGRDRFHPRPATDTGLMTIRRRPEPLIPLDSADDYRHMVHTGFSGVGGSIGASLARRHGRRPVAIACDHAELAPATPVGLVTPAQWLHLHRRLARL